MKSTKNNIIHLSDILLYIVIIMMFIYLLREYISSKDTKDNIIPEGYECNPIPKIFPCWNYDNSKNNFYIETGENLTNLTNYTMRIEIFYNDSTPTKDKWFDEHWAERRDIVIGNDGTIYLGAVEYQDDVSIVLFTNSTITRYIKRCIK